MRVDDIGRPRGPPTGKTRGEGTHVGQEVVTGNVPRRSGVDELDGPAASEPDPRGWCGSGSGGVDGDLGAEPDETTRERRDVDVLATRFGRAR
jgi:hypothetical protein